MAGVGEVGLILASTSVALAGFTQFQNMLKKFAGYANKYKESKWNEDECYTTLDAMSRTNVEMLLTLQKIPGIKEYLKVEFPSGLDIMPYEGERADDILQNKPLIDFLELFTMSCLNVAGMARKYGNDNIVLPEGKGGRKGKFKKLATFITEAITKKFMDKKAGRVAKEEVDRLMFDIGFYKEELTLPTDKIGYLTRGNRRLAYALFVRQFRADEEGDRTLYQNKYLADHMKRPSLKKAKILIGEMEEYLKKFKEAWVQFVEANPPRSEIDEDMSDEDIYKMTLDAIENFTVEEPRRRAGRLYSDDVEGEPREDGPNLLLEIEKFYVTGRPE